MDTELLDLKMKYARTERNEMAGLFGLAIAMLAFALDTFSDALVASEGILTLMFAGFAILATLGFFGLLISSIVKCNKKISTLTANREDVLNNTFKASTI